MYVLNIREIRKIRRILEQESPLGILTGHSDPPHP